MAKDKVSLTPVDLENDLELLLAWISHPKIYRWFYEQEKPPNWEAHYSLWHNRENRKDWLIKYKGRKVGSTSVTNLNTDVKST